MSSTKTWQITAFGEWAAHLRATGKRVYWTGERKAAQLDAEALVKDVSACYPRILAHLAE